MKSNERHSASRIKAQERMQLVLNMRLQGKSYRTIAAELNVSVTRAYRIADKAFANLCLETQEKTEKVRQQEIARQDYMLSCLWERIEQGDTKAVDSALKIQERRAKLLGLDAPTKVDQTSSDGSMSPQPTVDASRLSDEALEEILKARQCDDG